MRFRRNITAIQPDARRPRVRRRAGALVELAIAFPVVLYMAFGLVEFGQYMYIKNCFESAARDAARVAVMQNATQAQVTTTLTNTLAQANITFNSSWLTITDLGPSTTGAVSNIATVPLGDQLQFILSTNYSGISNVVRPLYSMSGAGIGSNKSVIGECTMVKE